MGPPPMVVAIVAIVFGSWAFVSVAKLVLTLFREKNAVRNAGQSLTSSELARIVQDAVEESVRPLEAKIERLEREQQLATAHNRAGEQFAGEQLRFSEHEAASVTRRADDEATPITRRAEHEAAPITRSAE